jgi:hypothetical protein
VAVTHYCATLADALAAVADVDGANLSTTTEPTLAEAQYLQDRATIQVRLAFLREGLSDSVTTDSFAHELARHAETMWTSYLVLIGKSSLLEEQQRAAEALRAAAQQLTGYSDPKTGKWVTGDVGHMRQVLLNQGATAELPAEDAQIANSWNVTGKDPDYDLTVGGNDIGYDNRPTFEESDPL